MRPNTLSPYTPKKGHARNATFARGGGTPTFAEQVTNTGKGQSAPGQFAQGGRGKMFGYHPSLPARGGITGAR